MVVITDAPSLQEGHRTGLIGLTEADLQAGKMGAVPSIQRSTVSAMCVHLHTCFACISTQGELKVTELR